MKPLAGTEGTSWERHTVEGGETLPCVTAWRCQAAASSGTDRDVRWALPVHGRSVWLKNMPALPWQHARSFPYRAGCRRALSTLPSPTTHPGAQRPCQLRLLCNKLEGDAEGQPPPGALARGQVGALLHPGRPCRVYRPPPGAAPRCCTRPGSEEHAAENLGHTALNTVGSAGRDFYRMPLFGQDAV